MTRLHVFNLVVLLVVSHCTPVEDSIDIRYAAIERDPAVISRAYPASMEPVTFTSAGKQLVGNLLVAQGSGPHPTAMVLHGFPGNENNYDLAHVLRRAGWNAFVFHYRGSWGSEGDFSFGGVLADVDAALDFLQKRSSHFRANPDRIVLIGHSMGGFAALMVAAKDERICAAASIAGFNFGAFTEMIRDDEDAVYETTQEFSASLAPLSGATGENLVQEMLQRGATWDLRRHVEAVRERPVLLVAGSRDGVAPPSLHHEPLVRSFRHAGVVHLTERTFDTDHAFSDKRVGLARTLLFWLDRVDRLCK